MMKPGEILTNLPPITKYASLLILGMSITTLFSNIFVLVPGNLLSDYSFHTFLTAGLISISPVQNIVNLAVFIPSSRYLEAHHGFNEFAWIFSILDVFPTLYVYFMRLLVFGSTSDVSQLERPIHGIWGIFMGFLVGFKQLVPEHTVKFFKGFVSVRVKYLPFAMYVTLPFACLFSWSADPLVQASTGFFTMWTYLRFIKKDRSEAFAFVTFFPDSLQALIRPISDTFYAILLSIGFVSASSASDVEAPIVTPSDEAAEAERRRALALKALETRLNYLQGAKSAVEVGNKVEMVNSNTSTPELK